METHVHIIVKVATVPGPNGPQAGMQVMFQAEGHKADDAAWILLALKQVEGAVFQGIIKAAAPRVMVPGGGA